jgi:hypothetical protein
MTALILAVVGLLIAISLLRKVFKPKPAIPMRSVEDIEGEKIVEQAIREARAYVKARADEREAEIRAGKL